MNVSPRRRSCGEGAGVVETSRTVTPDDTAPGTVQSSKGVPHEAIVYRPAAGTLRPAVAGRYPALNKAGPVSVGS